MQRLGRNVNGYFGERIDLTATLSGCEAAALAHGWKQDFLPPETLRRPAYFRKSPTGQGPRFYISTGMHGDEPAGPLAARRLLELNRWPNADLWLLPCLNPTGLRAGTRNNDQGHDINRDYRHFRTPEAQGHVDWLRGLPPLDLSLLLHEDWESHGFYVYELNWTNRSSLARPMVDAVRQICPIDESPAIDGREVSEPGIIRPKLTPEERPDWPEAIWLGMNKGHLSYTVEAPSDWPLEIRVQALVTAVYAAFNAFDPAAGFRY
ncbi:MAG: M14 family metallocarboxypeptidase [Verrucomicrobia bacterium]|nr:M14 family metallocarboxypeptidase [Verrucomicrobiota bacterium]